MIDILTHVPDIYAMNNEGREIALNEDHPLNSLFTIDDDNSITFNIVKIPVHYTDEGETLCLIRDVKEEDFLEVKSINIIGTCVDGEYIFNSDDDKLTYERVRGSLEFTYLDDEGNKQKGYKPYMIGVFT